MPVFTCGGLPNLGVMLVPPSAPEYPHLVEAIRLRARSRLEGAPPRPDIDALTKEELACSAILLNYSNKLIEQLSVRWLFETQGIRPRLLCRSGLLGVSEVLPLQPKHPLLAYWNTIMPGSVRLVTREHVYGDNRDIRPPQPDELHHGTWVPAAVSTFEQFDGSHVTLNVDSVLFEGGEFAGDDKCASWGQLNAEVAVKLKGAEIAKVALDSGQSEDEAIEQVLAYAELSNLPAASPESQYRQRLGQHLHRARESGSARDVLQALLALDERPKPLLRRV